MKAQELYNKLNELELEWEIAESFEGLRVINVAVDEDENEDVSLAQYISDYIKEEVTRGKKLEHLYLPWVIAQAIEAYRGGAR